MNDPVIQLAISIILILLLAIIAKWLRLGAGIMLRDEEMARELAIAAQCDFSPVETILDRDGVGALLSDDAGHIMLLRRHGAKFAGRLLDGAIRVDVAQNILTVDAGDARFGPTRLNLGDDAAKWAAKIENKVA